MINQIFDTPDTGAVVSDCGIYRYSLWRVWDWGAPACVFVMLNPSTADEIENDPTISRCISYAKRFGAGRLIVVNLFAFRSTDRKAMKAAADPVGPKNNDHIVAAALQADLIICAWGTDGAHRSRDQEVVRLLRGEHGLRHLYALKITAGGHPGHPLYLKGDMIPVLFHG